MNKILIEVYVPSIEQTFNLFIPINKSCQKIIDLIEKAIKEIAINGYPDKDNTVMIDKEMGTIYNQNVIIKDSGLKNGSKVILL